MKDIRESIAKLEELIEKVEIPDKIGYMSEHLALFRRTEIGTIDELHAKEEEFTKQLKENVVRMFLDYDNRVNIVEQDFGIKNLFFKNSEFADMPNGEAIFENVYALAYRDGRDVDWLEVYKLFCKYESLVVASLSSANWGGCISSEYEN